MKKLEPKLVQLIFRKIRVYLLVFVVFLVFISIGLVLILQRTKQTTLEIEKIKRLSIVDLNSIDREAVTVLSGRATELASFLPDEFNLYQVIALIEQIAIKTRFNIQSYDLKYVDVKPDSLQQQSLSLVGSGTLDQFMAFLREYKFITGKILTIDKVNLSGDKRILSNLQVNIYAYKPNITVDNQSIVRLDQIDLAIIDKVKKYYTSTKLLLENTDYSVKGNPFE